MDPLVSPSQKQPQARQLLGRREPGFQPIAEKRKGTLVFPAFLLRGPGSPLPLPSPGMGKPQLFGHLPENPGPGGGGPSHHHAVATRLLQHAHDIRGLLDIPIADDRDSHGIPHPADVLPVGLATPVLRLNSGMERDPVRSSLLQHSGKIHQVLGVVLEAGPHLHRERQGGEPPRRAHHLFRVPDVAHQGHSPVVLEDLADRTAHVDIDSGRREGHQLLERRRDPTLIVTQQLGNQVPLPRCYPGLGCPAHLLTGQNAGGQHLGKQQRSGIGRKVGSNQLAKGQV